ncbi:hypothetical protein EXIGLDRAFT_751251 [Exidia glandulosa HHB12029]|uniref:F-box domain-containing protein n=1 Tax=Exidia glandulosa HHB12029 TaxID=1314781 RepID=A0A165FNJ4_EXIGL|nr:hypothetical protein EXIGLDRAFT_751251 [Exidia glandulosa HHB12029]
MSAESTAATLPDDVLAHIMLLAAPYDPVDKIHMAQVSRWWRASALRNAQLWASFSFASSHRTFGLRYVLLFLQRSLTCDLFIAGLAVESLRMRLENDTPNDGASSSGSLFYLLPYAARIRQLHLYYARPFDTGDRVQLRHVRFPRLEDFKIFAAPAKVFVGAVVSLTSGSLRQLDLTYVRLDKWDLGTLAGLRMVRLCGCPLTSRVIYTILYHCKRLERLILVVPDGAAALSEPPKLIKTMHLTALDLNMHPRDVRRVLDSLDGARLSSISVAIPRIHSVGAPADGSLHPLLASVLRNVRSITNVAILSIVEGDIHFTSILLVGEAGHERRLVYQTSQLNFPVLWKMLAQNLSIDNTVRAFYVCANTWIPLATALAAQPPKNAVTLKLAPDIWTPGAVADLPLMTLPMLSVIYAGNGCYSRDREVQKTFSYILHSIATTSRSVQICVDAGRYPDDPVKAGMLRYLRDLMLWIGSGKCELCHHCLPSTL